MNYTLATKVKDALFITLEANYGRLWSAQFDKSEVKEEIHKIWLKIIQSYEEDVIQLALEKACEKERPPTPAQFRIGLKEAKKEFERKFKMNDLIREKVGYYRAPAPWLIEHIDHTLNGMIERKVPLYFIKALQTWMNSILAKGIWCEQGDEETWDQIPGWIEMAASIGGFEGYPLPYYKNKEIV